MKNWVSVINASTGGDTLIRARWCASYLCRLRGLTFRRSLPEGEGLLLVDRAETRRNAAIHMLGVFFPIGVAWITRDQVVVDLTVAKPWRFYVPKGRAQYILEGPPNILESITIGDRLEFVDVETA